MNLKNICGTWKYATLHIQRKLSRSRSMLRNNTWAKRTTMAHGKSKTQRKLQTTKLNRLGANLKFDVTT